jgi:3-oxoacyl-[acyl-carrier protein] reductase
MNIPPHPLNGQVALISGSSDLAGEVAVALAALGVKVSLLGTRMDLLELAAASVLAASGDCLLQASSLNTAEAAQEVLEKTVATYGRLDMLIFVSPSWGGGLIHEHNLRTWDLMMEVNLRQPFLLARAVLPHFREQRRGQLMAIGSDSALGIYQRDGAYNVALHGLNALMQLIQEENGEFGIRTHILSPGLALADALDGEGKPNLTTQNVADWALWLLTRPAHLRSNGPILI